MKWLVKFKEKKKGCCPPAYYYAIKETIVVADNQQEVEQKLKKGRIEIEIQFIQEITSYE